MKALILTASLAGMTLTMGSAAVMADDTPNADMSQAGNYVKNSVITTKVKAKLAEKHLSTLTHIQVDTDRQGVVWLSGVAPTQDASDLAELIAKGTDGVTGVHNKILVQ